MEQSVAFCAHCQEPCVDDVYHNSVSQVFCCLGCREVHAILSQAGLTGVYSIPDSPLPKANSKNHSRDILKDPALVKDLLDLSSEKLHRIRLKLPAIRCAACLWLLEKLGVLLPGILQSRLNFGKQELSLAWDPLVTDLFSIVSLLDRLGYPPDLNMGHNKSSANREYKTGMLEIGVAGFCFGNIMLLAFPEYLSRLSSETVDPALASFFLLLQTGLSLPVMALALKTWGKVFFRPLPYQSLDLPIIIGILVIYLVSMYQILWMGISGYLDSLSGLVFFLLLGRRVQEISYDRLIFDRDYQDWLPLGVDVISGTQIQATPVSKVVVGDKIRIQHQAILPCDATLVSHEALFDFSFITGEQEPVPLNKDALVFAGAKVLSSQAEFLVHKAVSQSYLSSIWSENQKQKAKTIGMQDSIAKNFSPALILLATLGFVFWLPEGFGKAIMVFSSVLIVACPCALALATPIGLGLGVRKLASLGLFLRDTNALEQLLKVRSCVLDKTGTLTQALGSEIEVIYGKISADTGPVFRSLAQCSSHPLSRRIVDWLKDYPELEVQNFIEVPGSGISGLINSQTATLGALNFVNPTASSRFPEGSLMLQHGDTEIVIQFKPLLRPGILRMLQSLSAKFPIYLLSGDRVSQAKVFSGVFSEDRIFMSQTPIMKREFVNRLTQTGNSPLVIGDGLNDTGAFAESQCSLAVIEKSGSLFPTADGIIASEMLHYLPQMLNLAQKHHLIIRTSLFISLFYNIIGLSFALSGLLEPVVCAILMPVSSLSVAIFSAILSSIFYKRVQVPWKFLSS